MADFNWIPLVGSTVSFKPKINEARFGGGYSQRTPKGINNNPQMWNSLRFIDDESELDKIMTFFELRGGVSSFTWKPPEGTELKFICSEWNRNLISKGRTSIKAKFEQVFE